MYAGELLAKITADASGLRREVATANASLKSLDTTARATSSGVSAGMASLDKAMGKVAVSTANLGLKFTAAALAASGLNQMIGGLFQAAKSAIIDYNSQMEQATIGFTTMLGSAEAAKKELANLTEFAARTPFEFSGLVGATQQLMAFGFEMKEVRPMLTAVGDTVAAMGGSMQDMGNRVIRALGQIQAKGRVQAEEMLQLTEANIGAWQYLADAMGLSVAETMDMSRKGMIDSATAIKAITAGMENDFAGMMEGQSKTLVGAMSTMHDYVQKLAGDMSKPLYEKSRDAILGLANYLSSPEVQSKALKWGETIANGLNKGFSSAGSVFNSLAPSMTQVKRLLMELKPVVISVGSTFVDLVKAGTSFAVELAKITGEFSKIAMPVVIVAFKEFAAVLEWSADLLANNAWLVKSLAIAYAAWKITTYTKQLTTFVSGLAASAKALLFGVSATAAQTAADEALTAAQIRLNAQYEVGVITLAEYTAAQTAAIDAAIAQSVASQGAATRMSAGFGKVLTKLGGMSKGAMVATGALAVLAVGMSAMSANAEQVQKSLDDMVTKGLEGMNTAPEKIGAIDKALQGVLKSNRDIEYSGGFWSDTGAAFSNVFNPNDMDFWTGGDSGNDMARKKWEAERKKVVEEYAKEMQTAYQKRIEEAKTAAENYAMSIAQGEDNINKEMKKAYDREVESYASLLDPMKKYSVDQQITFDDLVANMASNNQSLQDWKDNLNYLLKTGNADLAAYFAQLGPESMLAMNEMIQGGQTSIDTFRTQMTTGYKLAGQDASQAMYDGLSLIPTLAEGVNIDVLGHLEQMAKDAAAPAVSLTAAYKTNFDQIKTHVGEVFSEILSGMDASEPAVKLGVDGMVEAFNKIDPQTLVGAGLTPEALGLPQVQYALALLSQQGVTDPLVIQSNIAEVLQGIDGIGTNLKGYINPPGGYKLDVDADPLKNAWKQLTDIFDGADKNNPYEWIVDLSLKVNGISINNPDVLAQIFSYWGDPAAIGIDLTAASTHKADGGFVAAANGMLPKNARIQSPGTLVQWAEPETGGESFIPLAPSKRKRSVAIWQETGKRLGVFAYGGIMSFGNGGMTTPLPNGGSMTTGPDGTIVYNPPKPRSLSGSKGGGGGGGGTDWDSLLSNMYSVGDLGAGDYLKYLQGKLAGLKKYSEEWMQAYNDVQSVQDDFNKHAMEQQDVMHDFDVMSNDDYLKILNERLANTEKYSSDWASLMNQIASIQQEAVDAQQAAADHQRSIEDNQYTVGDTSTSDYLAILQERIKGLEKYSDEWTSLWQQITSIQQSEQDAQLQAAQDYTDALRSAFDAIVNPIMDATSLLGAFGNQDNVSFDQISGFFDHMGEATTRWMNAIDQLNAYGLDSSIMDQLMQMGPQSLGFAESILSQGQAGVDYINANTQAIAGAATQFGNDYAPGMVDNSVTIEHVEVNIGYDPNQSRDKSADIKTLIEDAFAELAVTIQTGASNG